MSILQGEHGLPKGLLAPHLPRQPSQKECPQGSTSGRQLCSSPSPSCCLEGPADEDAAALSAAACPSSLAFSSASSDLPLAGSSPTSLSLCKRTCKLKDGLPAESTFLRLPVKSPEPACEQAT